MKRSVLVLVAVAVIAGASLPALAGDFIKQKNGQWLVAKPDSDPPAASDFENEEGTVIVVMEENYDKIVYSVKVGDRSTKQEIDTSAVDKVYYSTAPEVYLDAVTAMESGDLDGAISGFQSVADNTSMRRWLREYSLANIATIYQGTYRFQQAIQAWDKLLGSFPKSRYAPTALVQSGNAALDMGNAEEAKKRFQRLQGLAGLPDAEKMKARYYLAKIIQKQGEASKNATLIGQALEEFKKLLAETEKVAELKDVASLAKLGIGECLIGLSKFGEALTYFQGIADSTEDPLMLAGVFNGLGLCYFRTEKWKEAMLAFLRVEVLYNSDSDKTAMALYYSGKCFEFMTGANIGQDNPNRARAQYRKCIQKYGGTSWGKMAAEALPNVRGK